MQISFRHPLRSSSRQEAIQGFGCRNHMKYFTLKNKILFGIYVIYCLRRLKNPLVAESLMFIMLAAVLSYLVSIPSVFSNMSASSSFYHYFIMAFSNTDFL